jgi:ATP-dependent DNA helicase RecG
MGKREISAALGQKEVSGQLNKVIRALLATGLITVTLPHKLGSRLQKYRLNVSVE